MFRGRAPEEQAFPMPEQASRERKPIDLDKYEMRATLGAFRRRFSRPLPRPRCGAGSEQQLTPAPRRPRSAPPPRPLLPLDV